MSQTNDPIAKAEILIRKPIAEVFNTFTQPDHITQFWFDKCSGPIEEDASIEWTWTIFDMTIPVKVMSYKKNEIIIMSWGSGNDQSILEWSFTKRSEQTTYVSLINRDFQGNIDEKIATALDSTGGFNLVIAAAKAYLEHGIKLNIVNDKF